MTQRDNNTAVGLAMISIAAHRAMSRTERIEAFSLVLREETATPSASAIQRKIGKKRNKYQQRL